MRIVVISILIYLFLFFIIALNCSLAEENKEYSELNSIYSINTNIKNIVVDPGEDATFGIFIGGVGDVDFAKLELLFPAEIVEQNIEVTILEDIYFPYNDTLDFSSGILSYQTVSSRSVFILPLRLFEHASYSPMNIGNIETENKELNRYDAPIMIKVYIKNDIKPGDYETSFVLYYLKNQEWSKDSTTMNIHVKAFYENEIVEIITILAALSAIVAVYAKIFEYIQKVIVRFYRWLTNKISRRDIFASQKGKRKK